MGNHCEFCGKDSDDEETIFCKYCGSKFVKPELDVLKKIEVLMKTNQEKAQRIAKSQTRIALASLIISIGAILFALGASLMVVIQLPSEYKWVGLVIMATVIVLFGYIVNKINVAPVNLDEIE